MRKRRSVLELARLARFALVGFAAMAVYWLIANALTSLASFPLLAASLVGHLVAGLISYLGHMTISFRVAVDHSAYGLKFLIVAVFGVLINVVIIAIGTKLDIAPSITTLGVGCTIPTVNYILNRLWVFASGIDAKDDAKEAV